MPWPPTRFKRFEAYLATSTQTCIVVTDGGKGYLKALGNRQGPHVLACEWVGTAFARWIGLPTLEYALLEVQADDTIPLALGRNASPGRGFITRKEKGNAWGGDRAELENIANPADIPAMVVFDTWTLNCDRHPPEGMGREPNPDNVFISRGEDRPARPMILPIDQGHCFTCGGDLGPALSRIERIVSERVYGLFPEFLGFMQRDVVRDVATRLSSFDEQTALNVIGAIPPEWEVAREARAALVEFSVRRAAFVAANIEAWLAPRCWPAMKGPQWLG